MTLFFLEVHLTIRGAKVTGHSMFYHVASIAKYLSFTDYNLGARRLFTHLQKPRSVTVT